MDSRLRVFFFLLFLKIPPNLFTNAAPQMERKKTVANQFFPLFVNSVFPLFLLLPTDIIVSYSMLYSLQPRLDWPTSSKDIVVVFFCFSSCQWWRVFFFNREPRTTNTFGLLYFFRFLEMVCVWIGKPLREFEAKRNAVPYTALV